MRVFRTVVHSDRLSRQALTLAEYRQLESDLSRPVTDSDVALSHVGYVGFADGLHYKNHDSG